MNTTFLSAKTAIHDLFHTVGTLESYGDTLFKPFGLTTKQFAILRLIHEGHNTSSLLQQQWGHHKSTIAQKIKQLEQKKLLIRTVSEHDNRVWIFSLTDLGQQNLFHCMALYKEVLATVFQNFSQSEIEALSQLLNKLSLSELKS